MKATIKSAFGTSFHGTTIIASVTDLRQILGLEQYEANDGNNKTNFVWIVETDNDDVFTVYDWKAGTFGPNTLVKWHIGGHTGKAAEKGAAALKRELAKITENGTLA